MDSGNSSGSMQSSNGRAAGDNNIYDQDFDSRGESEYSISNSFLMNNPSIISTPHQTQIRNENLTSFHPQQQNLDHHATTQYSINHHHHHHHHHDPIWARPPYSSYPTTNGPNFSPLPPPPPPPPSKTAQSAGPSSNPKKRTRASRRAPTTVLTTDTANFRQMVQEFTGIPAGPDMFSGLAFGPLYPPLIRPSPRNPSSAHHEINPPSMNMDAINSNDDYPFLNIQPKTDQLAGASMNLGNLMSGFLSRHEIPVTSANTSGNDDDDNLMSSRWRSRGDQT